MVFNEPVLRVSMLGVKFHSFKRRMPYDIGTIDCNIRFFNLN
jgi:hypothetical protein